MVRPSLIQSALTNLPLVPDKTLRLLAAYLRREGVFDDAGRVIDELKRRQGLTGPLLDLRADLAESRKDWAGSRRLREDRVSRFPDAQGWIRLARFYIDQRPAGVAERLRDIEREMDRLPESDLALEMARIEVAYERGRIDDARGRAETLVMAAPRSSRPALFLARIAAAEGQPAVARRHVAQVVEKFGTRAAEADVRALIAVAERTGLADVAALAANLLSPDRRNGRDLLEAELTALYEAPEPEPIAPEATPEFMLSEPDLAPDDPVLRTLRDVWGYDELRPGQAQVIRQVLDGLDTLAIMPTGSGKSITFQLPALLLDGPVVVVSPLIALMHDQLTTLPEPLRSQSTYVNSTLQSDEMDRRLDGIARGQYRLIYAAPERLRQATFLSVLRTAGVRLVVIDEAHCVSMWGHDFRPDYFFLARALEELGDPPTLAVTATATTAMAQQIGTSLGRTFAIIRTSSFRENLFYSVEKYATADAKAKRLVALCKEEPGSTIVYVSARKHADDLAARLRENGIRASAYHAGMATQARTTTQNGFLANSIQVIVATIAFGMGINKPDVRLIVHYSPSRSLEAYIQESGRAGRDSAPARCVLLFTPGDTSVIRRHATEQPVTIEDLRQVYRGIRQAAAGRWSIIDRFDLASLGSEATDVNVAIGLLEHAALIRRQPDTGRMLMLRWSQRSAESDAIGSSDRFGQWLSQVSSGSAIVTVPTATACAELDCSPAVLERAIAAHHGVAAAFQMPSVCLEILPAGQSGKVDMQALLDRLQASQRERAEQMIAYLGGSDCRHVALARHLGERIPACGDACDRCTAKPGAAGVRQRSRSERRDDPYFAALAQWRTEKARERVVPAFVIASDRLLDRLASERPTTRAALRGLTGIGDIKDREFGAEIIDVIRAVESRGHSWPDAPQ